MMTFKIVLFLATSAAAFYLPGVAPRDFQLGETIDLKVNRIDSVQTQLYYSYYSLPVCTPAEIKDSTENLGEVLGGDLIENSPYAIEMKVPMLCRQLCAKQMKENDLTLLGERIQEGYRINYIIDNMPAASKYYVKRTDLKGTTTFSMNYEEGYPLGFLGSEEIDTTHAGIKYINNHIRMTILYHESAEYEGARIVGFEVEPMSIKHIRADDGTLSTCNPENPANVRQGEGNHQDVSGKGQEIIFTYDVVWDKSNVRWASRWDTYLKMTNPSIHWFSIINSIMIVLFLSGMVAMVMLRTLLQDFRRYNQIDMDEESIEEETGWKLIHGEVFRPPDHGGLFAIFVGTGVQVFAMTLLTLVFALLGFLSPANRGGLMTALLLLFTFMGILSGCVATRVYRFFKLTAWKKNTLMTALLFPGVSFTMFFVLNLVVWSTKSSGAVPFSTLVALLVLWLGCSVPLVYAGSYAAFQLPIEDPPLRVNNIPRQIPPPTVWYAQPSLSMLIGGILPFAAVFIEIFFIMSSVWHHRFYYVFGFLFAVFVILCVTCAEISIVMTYFTLCSEDYHWWWRSFLTPGSSALYLFLYSIVYYFTKLNIIGGVSTFLFFGYMTLASFTFFLLTGTIGFLTAHWFVTRIYSSIKID